MIENGVSSSDKRASFTRMVDGLEARAVEQRGDGGILVSDVDVDVDEVPADVRDTLITFATPAGDAVAGLTYAQAYARYPDWSRRVLGDVKRGDRFRYGQGDGVWERVKDFAVFVMGMEEDASGEEEEESMDEDDDAAILLSSGGEEEVLSEE